MASVADAISALDEIKVPQGVVIPPKEIKGTSCVLSPESVADKDIALLERTAGYVVRNGVAFEGKLLYRL